MKKYAILLAAAGILFAACRKDDVPEPSGPKERTLLIYMAAQNSLGQNGEAFDYKNIESLLSGIESHHLLANNIVIYHDPIIMRDGRSDFRPRLLKVEMGAGDRATTREIEIFAEQNSASGEVMGRVIDKVLKNTELEADRYGFLMWSHGTGWLPPDPDYTLPSRAIGQDVGADGDFWMDIDEFAEAIPDGVFDYIVVDACYMGSVEFAYALRNDADYLIASPIEIMAAGMPYRLMPDYLLGAAPDYEGFCDAFYGQYADDYGAAVSLIDLGRMEALAGTVREVLAGVSMEQIHTLPIAEMQHFDRLVSKVHPYHLFFDLGDFMERIAPQGSLQQFGQAMAAAIPHERHSESFLLGNGGFEIERYCGLSAYVPRNLPQLDAINAYYLTSQWYRAVYPSADPAGDPE